MTGAETHLGAFGRQIEATIGTLKTLAAGIGVAFVFDKIKSATEAAINLGNSIENGSRKLGLTTDAYQKWGYVIKESGGNIDGMSRAFSALAKEAAKSDKILDVSTRDTNGNLKDMGTLFGEVVERIAAIPNPTERAAAAQKVFGKAGQEVFNIASQGKDKIRELSEETDKYGFILDKKLLLSLNEAKLAQERMNTAWERAAVRLTGTLAPAVEWYARVLSGENLLKAAREIQVERTVDQYKAEKDVNSLFILRGQVLEKIDQEQMKPHMDKDRIKELQDEARAYGRAINDINNEGKENAPSQFKDLLGDKKKEKQEPLPPGFYTDAEIKILERQDKEQKDKKAAADQADWHLQYEIWKQGTTRIDNDEKRRREIQQLQDDYDLKQKEQNAQREIEIRQRVVDASFAMGQSLMRLGEEGVRASKMQAQQKKELLIAMAIADAAAAAVKGIYTVWNGEGEAWYKIAMTAVVSADIIASAWSQISAIQSASFASGTNFAPGGWANVGERGPERVYLPRGSQVINHNQTSQMTQGHTFIVNINSTGTVSETLHAELRSGDPGVKKLVSKLSEMM
jgi:hypothetical protein